MNGHLGAKYLKDGIWRYAGGCQGFFSDKHPNAPQGVSFCTSCKRIVCRGMGKWW